MTCLLRDQTMYLRIIVRVVPRSVASAAHVGDDACQKHRCTARLRHLSPRPETG